MGHLTFEELDRALRALPPPPRDAGSVALVVARPVSNARLTPERAELTPEGGLVGDRWSLRPSPNPDNQITLMRADVARLMSGGTGMEWFGDNLLVELDLSESNLPAGTRLGIGEAICEVTPLPHTGCGKFAERFGSDARAITGAPEHASSRLRGIHVRVVERGAVGPGDPIRVLNRPV